MISSSGLFSFTGESEYPLKNNWIQIALFSQYSKLEMETLKPVIEELF